MRTFVVFEMVTTMSSGATMGNIVGFSWNTGIGIVTLFSQSEASCSTPWAQADASPIDQAAPPLALLTMRGVSETSSERNECNHDAGATHCMASIYSEDVTFVLMNPLTLTSAGSPGSGLFRRIIRSR